MIATKEQEREALEKIKAIVEGLGENSYVATAFAGCFEIAEENIEYDAADSLKERLEIAERRLKSDNEQLKAAECEIEQLIAKNDKLEKQVDKLAEWEFDPDAGTKFPQSKYNDLLQTSSGTRVLTDDEAIALIEEEFGFNAKRIKIIHHVETYKKSRRLGICKVLNEFERKPLYNATDWNYIRFDCANLQYEMINGQLEQYYD